MKTERIDMKIKGLNTTIHFNEFSGADSSLSQANTSKTSSNICVENAINIAGEGKGTSIGEAGLEQPNESLVHHQYQ